MFGQRDNGNSDIQILFIEFDTEITARLRLIKLAASKKLPDLL
jgi:hypothetical protein